MLELFRSFMKSKAGVGVTLGFLVLLALAFASGDILSFGGLGGAREGTKVAVAGDRKITASTLDTFARATLERSRQENPGQTMKSLVASGGLRQILDGLIDNAAMATFGQEHGIVAGGRLVGSELAKEPGFRGADGNFDERVYRAAIGQRGFGDKVYRELISDGLVSEQVQLPAAFGARVPRALLKHYAEMITETREGEIALLPSAAFAPKREPGATEIEAYYKANRSKYIRPERRVIRYAVFDDSVVKDLAPPSDAEIAARYEADKAKYAPSETRKLTQVIVPTEAGARVVLEEAAKGKSLDAAVRSKGLVPSVIGAVTRESYAGQTSAAVAQAVFAAAQGANVGPVKGALGWYVVRVDAVTRNPGKSIEQARGEIVEALNVTRKRAALTDFSARIEEEFDDGATLADVAKELGKTFQQTASLTSDGKVYGKPDQGAPPEIAPVLQTAFLMESEGQPQLAEVVPGKTFVVFDVTSIEPSAPAPLDEVKAQVVAGLQLEKGAVEARKAASKVEAEARKGQGMDRIMASLPNPLPPVDHVNMPRMQLAAMQQGVPPPLNLFFAMAKGSVKLLKAPNDRGWYVIWVKSVTPGKVEDNSPVLQALAQNAGRDSGREYAEQLRQAIRDEVGVSRDAGAMRALTRQLTGAN